MSRRLTIAIPSKGRIMEGVYAFFVDAGLPVVKSGGVRDYVGKIGNLPKVDVLFMSSAEIAAALEAGNVHLGVTGEDLMQECAADMATSISLLRPLGIGQADVVVAVPAAWVDVSTMVDLEEVSHDFRNRHHRPLRVATKYLALTRRFFAQNGLSDYRIVESTGATEGAPAAGTADLIVDITTSGATLKANNLKILDGGVILESQAYLAASLNAKWSKTARSALSTLLGRVAARGRAVNTTIVRFQLKKGFTALGKSLEGECGCVVTRAPAPDGEIQCPDENLTAVIEALRAAGATALTATRTDYIFSDGNPLMEAFDKRLG